MERLIDADKVYRAPKARTRDLIADVLNGTSALPHDFRLPADQAQEGRDCRLLLLQFRIARSDAEVATSNIDGGIPRPVAKAGR